MTNANSSLFSDDQCLMVDGNKVTVRGFDGSICLELPTAGLEGQVYLTESPDPNPNEICSLDVSLEQFL